jgi:hypothetical protein
VNHDRLLSGRLVCRLRVTCGEWRQGRGPALNARSRRQKTLSFRTIVSRNLPTSSSSITTRVHLEAQHLKMAGHASSRSISDGLIRAARRAGPTEAIPQSDRDHDDTENEGRRISSTETLSSLTNVLNTFMTTEPATRPYEESRSSEAQRVVEDKSRYRTRAGAERDPNADLSRSLSERVRQHSIEPGKRSAPGRSRSTGRQSRMPRAVGTSVSRDHSRRQAGRRTTGGRCGRPATPPSGCPSTFQQRAGRATRRRATLSHSSANRCARYRSPGRTKPLTTSL